VAAFWGFAIAAKGEVKRREGLRGKIRYRVQILDNRNLIASRGARNLGLRGEGRDSQQHYERKVYEKKPKRRL